MMRICLVLALCLANGNVLAAARLSLGTPTGNPTVPKGLSGTVLPVWGSRDKYLQLSEGLRRGGFSLFRFPNGTLSNEYHWNGKGQWDSMGVWHASREGYAPGFLADLLRRGTTRDNYGSTFPSQVLDGDTSTYWWGNGGDSARPWFVLDFRSVQAVDSVEILWGRLRPTRVRLQSFRGGDEHGQGPHTALAGTWSEVGTVPVKSGRTTLRLRPDSSRSLALRFEGLSDAGVQLREVTAWSKGQQITKNVGTAREQTRGIALGTAPSSQRKRAWQPRDWDFETYMATIAKEWPGSDPLICVNLGTGTPEEAAAWVNYANKVKGYGIRRWQVGNENNGDWEDGGPLDAAQVAERFLAFARAMKAEDPGIEVFGPVYASMDWKWCGSGKADGKTWMGTFLERVGKAEASDGRRYLDGVDFHAYPYWWDTGAPDPARMLAAADRLGGLLDTLGTMMRQNLSDPGSRQVAMSEFNATVKATYLTMTHHTGSLVALMLGHLAVRYGERAVSCLWEPAAGEPMNPDGSTGATYGSLRAFTPVRRGLRSDLGDAPTGAFWGQYLSQLWMDAPEGGLRPLELRMAEGGTLRAFGLGKSGRASILLVNLGAVPDTVRLDSLGAFSASGELLAWGEEQYRWDGTTSKAVAFPNAGPVARPWSRSQPIVVPAFGTSVLQLGPRRRLPPRSLHRVISSGTLRLGDTLEVCVSVAQVGGGFRSAWWRLDDGRRQDLASQDGAWDASHEVARLRLAASVTGIGKHRLVLDFEAQGARLEDTIAFAVTGPLRTNAWTDRFEDGLEWSPYVHKDPQGSRLDLSVGTHPDTAGNRSYLSFEFALRQPSDLPYPNFATAGWETGAKGMARLGAEGMVFDYSARYDNGQGTFSLSLLSDRVKDYDWHRKVLEPTGGRWVRDTVWFSELTQEGWGRPVGPLDPATVSRVELRAQGAGAGELKFDNFCLIGTGGESVAMPSLPKMPRRRGR